MAARPFTIDVPDAVLDDLRRRLEQTRWPDEIPGTAWDYGSNLGYMKELVEYWRTRFDWRAQERYLNSLPHFKAQVDGLGIHFIHLKGKGPAPLPLIVTHGWPGSFFEMYKIAGPLTDPASHGGDPADAFDLVVPSLPGYGFSDMPKERGIGVGRTAELWTKLMTDVLGYPRFGAQGGDWGAAVTTALGYLSPKNVVGIHVNMVLGRAVGDPVGEMSPAEQHWREATWRSGGRRWQPGAPTNRPTRSFREPSRKRWPMALTIRQRAWRRGSWRSGARGAIAAATSKACTPRMSCSPT